MPVTNPAGMISVRTTFNGPNNLTAYYRGGAYVPINSTTAISTSASSLALSQFNGAVAGTSCPLVGCFLPGERLAREVVASNKLHLSDAVTLDDRQGVVTYSQSFIAPCVRITTSSGATLSCSTTAPIPTFMSNLVLANVLAGHMIPVMRGLVKRWERVVDVADLGWQLVQHITCENACFWVGDVFGVYILHHNQK